MFQVGTRRSNVGAVGAAVTARCHSPELSVKGKKFKLEKGVKY